MSVNAGGADCNSGGISQAYYDYWLADTRAHLITPLNTLAQEALRANIYAASRAVATEVDTAIAAAIAGGGGGVDLTAINAELASHESRITVLEGVDVMTLSGNQTATGKKLFGAEVDGLFGPGSMQGGTEVYRTAPGADTYPSALGVRSYYTDPTLGGAVALNVEVNFVPASGTPTVEPSAIEADANVGGSVNVPGAAGIYAYVAYFGSATLARAAALKADDVAINNGTITEQFGLLIKPQTQGLSNYAWYYDEVSPSYLNAAGNLVIAGTGAFTGAISASNYSGTHSGTSSGTNSGDQASGAGLTGTSTLAVGANVDGSIVVNADDIQVGVLATDAQHGNRGGGGLHALATSLAHGFMSSTDKGHFDTLYAANTVDVTLGSTNGLSIAGQAISMSLAGLGTTGTISSSAQDIYGDKTFHGRILGLSNPTQSDEAANKAYVDLLAYGMDVKGSCRAATTANITLSGAQTIDGIACIAGDRVLVKAQSTAADNGIYVVAAGGWTRSVDADASAEVTSGLYTFVSQGTANGGTSWTLTTADPITLGSTSLSFTQVAGPGTVTVGSPSNGLSISGLVLTLAAATTGQAGAMTATTQTLQGPKTWSDAATFSSTVAINGQVTQTAVGGSTFTNTASAVGGTVLALKNTDTTGYSGIFYMSSGGTYKGQLAYANASATSADSQGKMVFDVASGVDWVWTVSGTKKFLFDGTTFASTFVGAVTLGASTSTQLNVRRATATDDGVYLTTVAGNDAYFSAGSAWNGSNWVAKVAAPGIFAFSSGAFGWWADSGKSIGGTYTPTQILALSTGGVMTQSAASSNGSQYNIRISTATNDGGYFTVQNSANFVLSAGAQFDGTNWICRTTGLGAAMVSIGPTSIDFHINSGLTNNASFTRNRSVSIGPSGVFSAAILRGNTNGSATSIKLEGGSVADGAGVVSVIMDTAGITWANATARLVSFRNGGSEKLWLGAAGKFFYDSTDSSSTPGNVTINKPSGKAAIAAGAAAVTVTNSQVLTTSIVLCALQTADATATDIRTVVPAAGSFTVTVNANATAATTIGFLVLN